MSIFNFFNKKPSQAEKFAQLEKLLTQTTRWKFRGIRHIYLDVDFGEAFLEDVAIHNKEHISLEMLKQLGNQLRKDNQTFSRQEIEDMGKQLGINMWEAFDWEKEYFETMQQIKNMPFSA